jgi:hypothetical protein
MVTVTGAPNASAMQKAVASYRVESDPMAAQPTGGSSSQNGFSGSTPARWFAGHGQVHHRSDRATLMTIRIKQSDAQALAEHKMSHEDFIKAAQVTTYLGPSAQPETAELHGR